MSANPFDRIQEQIGQLYQKAGELTAKIESQQQTITYLWIAVGVLTVISIVALGFAVWRNRK
jgi:nitrate reductase NapE component